MPHKTNPPKETLEMFAAVSYFENDFPFLLRKGRIRYSAESDIAKFESRIKFLTPREQRAQLIKLNCALQEHFHIREEHEEKIRQKIDDLSSMAFDGVFPLPVEQFVISEQVLSDDETADEKDVDAIDQDDEFEDSDAHRRIRSRRYVRNFLNERTHPFPYINKKFGSRTFSTQSVIKAWRKAILAISPPHDPPLP